MITEEEIENIAKLMKIEIDDHKEYIEKVQHMIGYFDILDSAGVEGQELSVQELSIEDLRKDEHVSFDGKLIEDVKNYKGSFVRAPKMS